jgi:hypothetical protein
MSGEQERRNGLARPDQPDLIDSTLTMSRPAGREQGLTNGHRRDGLPEDGGVSPADAPDHRAPDHRAPDHRAPDHRAPDHRAPVGEIAEPAQAQAAAEPLSPAEPRRPSEHIAARAPESHEPARHRPDAVNNRPKPGSLADFRQRLERLPYGHPSSPYHVDGERKPPPPRLRHLELAPPAAAPARPPALPAPALRHAPAPSAPMLPTAAPPSAAARTASVLPALASPPAPAPPADVLAAPAPRAPSGQALSEQALSGQALSEQARAEQAPSEQARAEQAPSEQARAEQAPSEQARAEQAVAPHTPPWRVGLGAREPALRGHEVPAAPDPTWTSPGGASSTQPREPQQAASHGSLGSPGSHPPGRFQADRPARDAPQIAADGSWNWGPARLTRDQVRIAEDAYDRFRAADGRSLLGGHDRGSGLTAAMRRIEELGHGRLGAGTADRALLPPDVFRARLADMLRRHPDRTTEQLSMRVPGALCYVFVLEDKRYADGIRDIEEALYNKGYQLQARKNGWTSPANRSVFTIWHDPFNDVPFQVQFHTEASLDAQRRGRSPTSASDPGARPAQAETIRLAGS